MKSNRIQNSIFTIGFSILLIACGDGKTTSQSDTSYDSVKNDTELSTAQNAENSSTDILIERRTTSQIIDNYLAIKNALVQDDSKSAANFGQILSESAKIFDVSEYEGNTLVEVKEILEVIIEHGEHISYSDIAHQREHFEIMTTDFVDLIAIAGTDRTLHKQFCPMYDDGKGGIWLSESEEIKNPLYGSKMLTCGSVEDVLSVK